MSPPRAASSPATTCPMRLPPVMSATLSLSSIYRRPFYHEVAKPTKSTRYFLVSLPSCLRDEWWPEREEGRDGRDVTEGGGKNLPAPPASPGFPALVRERPEEGGALVRIAPLGAESGAAERVLVGHADGRVLDRRQGVEPLRGAASRIVRHLFVDVARHLGRRDVDP